MTPRLHEQFGYAYDAAWNLNYRTNDALTQSFAVNNLNELSTAGRSGTLTVAGAASERRAAYEGDYGLTNVTVSGTGLSSGEAEVCADGSWASSGLLVGTLPFKRRAASAGCLPFRSG